MTTIAAASLSESLQKLIDARLDTIDRMLLGRVNRHDRLAIVREVESQIHDLLQDRDPGSLDREDVLAVLARLDPPEAYLPDEPDETSTAAWTSSAPRVPSRDQGRRSRAGRVSGIVGLVSMGMILVSVAMFFLAELAESEIILFVVTFGTLGLTFVLGVVATTLAAYVKLRGAWAVVGLVTGILSTIIALASGVLLLMMI
jgi:hypothetical protein